MTSPAVVEGRELAAQAIEAEARGYEAQFGKAGPGGEAAAVLRMAADIARGHLPEDDVTPEQFAQYKAEADPARLVECPPDPHLVISALAKMILEEFPSDNVAEIVDTYRPLYHQLTADEIDAVKSYFK